MAMIEVRDDAEKLVAEQALLAFRASKRAMFVAPVGRGLETTEAAVLEEGRKLSVTMLEQVLQVHPETGRGG